MQMTRAEYFIHHLKRCNEFKDCTSFFMQLNNIKRELWEADRDTRAKVVYSPEFVQVMKRAQRDK